MSKTLKVEDVARILQCSENTVYSLIRSRRLRALRLGRTYRIPPDAINELELDVRKPALAA